MMEITVTQLVLMELYWIYYCKPGESNAGLRQGCWLYKMDVDTEKLAASATSWAVTGSGTPNGWPDKMEFKIIIWFITKQLKCGLLL
jgi:hypothetical protein